MTECQNEGRTEVAKRKVPGSGKTRIRVRACGFRHFSRTKTAENRISFSQTIFRLAQKTKSFSAEKSGNLLSLPDFAGSGGGWERLDLPFSVCLEALRPWEPPCKKKADARIRGREGARRPASWLPAPCRMRGKSPPRCHYGKTPTRENRFSPPKPRPVPVQAVLAGRGCRFDTLSYFSFFPSEKAFPTVWPRLA